MIVDEIARDLETVVIEQNPNDGLYYVSGQGQFRRVVEPSSGPQVNAPATSDFHNKFMQHELFHIQQWESIDPWGNLWDVDAFYNAVLSNLPGEPSEAAMREVVQEHFDEWDDANFQIENDPYNICEKERQAYEHEHNFEPRYLEYDREDICNNN